MNHDDPTPTAPLRPQGILADERVVITRGESMGAQGEGVVVTFDCRRGSLTVTLWTDRRVTWKFTPGGPCGPILQEGGDVTWRWGRLVRTGPEALALLAIREHLGLSFGTVEAELRQMTGYVDGTE